MRRTRFSTQSGFSLIEMLIVIAMSSVVMIGLVQVFSNTVGANSATLRQSRMTQDLRSVMDIMVSELRRAGYWQQAEATGNPAGNPNGVTALDGNAPVTACIQYSYDPAPPAVPGANTRSFGLDAQGQIAWNRAVNTCNMANANWEAITDSTQLTITNFTITDRSNCTNLTTGSDCNPCHVGAGFVAWSIGDSLYQVRQFDISITASPVVNNGPAATPLTLTDSVRVRNNETGTATAAGAAAVCGGKLPV